MITISNRPNTISIDYNSRPAMYNFGKSRVKMYYKGKDITNMSEPFTGIASVFKIVQSSITTGMFNYLLSDEFVSGFNLLHDVTIAKIYIELDDLTSETM